MVLLETHSIGQADTIVIDIQSQHDKSYTTSDVEDDEIFPYTLKGESVTYLQTMTHIEGERINGMVGILAISGPCSSHKDQFYLSLINNGKTYGPLKQGTHS